MNTKKIVLTTTGTREEAHQIARTLVERRRAACVSVVGPIESVYRWKQDVESAEEWMLLIKTTAAAFDDVWEIIREMHSYELPECIQLPIEAGSDAYLNWIGENVD